MKKAIMATKIGMTQIFREDGSLIPVTVLEAGPCVVTQVKTIENDGYEAVQVGFGDAKERITTVDKNGKKEVAHRHGVGKAMKGHFEKAGVSVRKHVQEFKFENAAEYKLGDEIKADIFAEGDKIDATAVTKGIPGRDQEIRTAQRTYGTRFQVPPPSGFQRIIFRSQQSLQGQGNARTHGKRSGHDPEPGSSKG